MFDLPMRICKLNFTTNPARWDCKTLGPIISAILRTKFHTLARHALLSLHHQDRMNKKNSFKIRSAGLEPGSTETTTKFYHHSEIAETSFVRSELGSKLVKTLTARCAADFGVLIFEYRPLGLWGVGSHILVSALDGFAVESRRTYTLETNIGTRKKWTFSVSAFFLFKRFDRGNCNC
jgi:hypothetical protein